MDPIVVVSNLDKIYASGHHALKSINLEIRRGEIFALLGPNGAGKTTLIGVICGLVRPTAGSVTAAGIPSALAVAFSARLRTPRTSNESCANFRYGTRRTAR